MTSSSSPTWSVQNDGSFASVSVLLPGHSEVCCESDAVVSFSESVTVRGTLSGGILGSLARVFLTNETFFTTKVSNTSGRMADVLMAPYEPGGIVLHKLDENGLYLTSGAYIACDSSVQISSRVQSRIGNSIFSGTGMFLLHARGSGTVACGAYGAVHTFRLQPGQVRAVDNGHLVAWTGQMMYTTGLASGGSGGAFSGIVDSITSGEGLMCFFEGPGTLYIQSHKPSSEPAKRTRHTTQGGNPIGLCLFVIVFLFIAVVIVFGIFTTSSKASYSYRYQHYDRPPRQHGYRQLDNNEL